MAQQMAIKARMYRFNFSAHLSAVIIITCIYFVNRASCELLEEERQFFNDLRTANPTFSFPNEENPCEWRQITCSEDSLHVIGM